MAKGPAEVAELGASTMNANSKGCRAFARPCQRVPLQEAERPRGLDRPAGDKRELGLEKGVLQAFSATL